MGFGFEDFDGVGQRRDIENGMPVDKSGSIAGVESLDDKEAHTFSGNQELAAILRDSDNAKACLALQYYRFGRGYEERRSDACSLSALRKKFEAGGLTVRDLLVQPASARVVHHPHGEMRMSMRTSALSRRNFVRGLGSAAALAPFLGSLHTARVRAAAPKRVLFVYVPDGCIPSRWHPTGTETDFTLPEMSAPLEQIKQHLVFIDGLTMYSGGATHEGGAAKVLTGVSPQSLDIFLGDKIGTATSFRSLQLGVGATFQSGSGSISYIGEKQQVNPDDDPLNVFTRVFGSVGGGADEDLAKRKKQSVLDAALGDLAALQDALGSTEKQKLDVHLDSLREVEARLMGGGAPCGMPSFDRRGFSNVADRLLPQDLSQGGELQDSRPDADGSGGAGAVVRRDQRGHRRCCRTRCRPRTSSRPTSPPATTMPRTTATPDSQNAKDFVTLKRWFMDQFVYLIQKLESTPDEGGSLLSNTVVMLCSELGDSNLHDHDRVPFVLAGKAGGALRTGRFLDYRGKNKGKNEPHNKLLVSVAKAAGVEVESFGYTGEGTGGLSGLLG